MSSLLEITEAKNRIDELLARAKAGEEIVLADQGRPVVRLGPAGENPRLKAHGMYQGQGWIAEDFDAPLSEAELKEWGL